MRLFITWRDMQSVCNPVYIIDIPFKASQDYAGDIWKLLKGSNNLIFVRRMFHGQGDVKLLAAQCSAQTNIIRRLDQNSLHSMCSCSMQIRIKSVTSCTNLYK